MIDISTVRLFVTVSGNSILWSCSEGRSAVFEVSLSHSYYGMLSYHM